MQTTATFLSRGAGEWEISAAHDSRVPEEHSPYKTLKGQRLGFAALLPYAIPQAGGWLLQASTEHLWDMYAGTYSVFRGSRVVLRELSCLSPLCETFQVAV